jgi:hypothetical protein
MSITVQCPQGHIVTLDDGVRRDAACPRCGCPLFADEEPLADSFCLPAGMAARPEPRRSRDEDDDDPPRKRKPRDDEEDEPPRRRPARSADDDEDRPRRRRPARAEPEEDEEDEEADEVETVALTRKQKRMATVRLGILFHILKLWTFLGAMLFGLITLPLVLFTTILFGNVFGMILSQITFNLSMTLAPIFGIIGSIMCAFVPPRSEARGTIIASVVFDVLAPLFGLLQLIMVIAYWGTGDERVERLVGYMLYARLACTLVAWWMFQLYLRQLGFFMSESLLASESLNVIVHFLIATIIGPTLVIVTFIMFAVFPGILVLVFFLATLGWVIYFLVTFPIRQFRLLFNMRSKIYQKYLKPDDD